MSGVADERPGAPNRTRQVLRGAAEVPIIAGLAVLIVVVLRALVVQPFYIPSPSMVPQLNVNDKILVSRVSYRVHGVHRGDLVVFNAPSGVIAEGTGHHGGPLNWVTERLGLTPRNDVLVKRVIGLPGDHIELRDGHVYVGGRLLLEPYLRPGTETLAVGSPTLVVPPHEIWVLGDNRSDSDDSRYFGPVRVHSIIGRAIVRVWPLDRISFL
jgi:signal peptidase I